MTKTVQEGDRIELAEKVPVTLTREQIRLVLYVLKDTAEKWEEEASRDADGFLTKVGRKRVGVAQRMRQVHAQIDEARCGAVDA